MTRLPDEYEIERYMRETQGGRLLSSVEFSRLAQAILDGKIVVSLEKLPSTKSIREMLADLDQDTP